LQADHDGGEVQHLTSQSQCSTSTGSTKVRRTGFQSSRKMFLDSRQFHFLPLASLYARIDIQTNVPLEIQIRVVDLQFRQLSRLNNIVIAHLLSAPDLWGLVWVVWVDGECKVEFPALVDTWIMSASGLFEESIS
jgi:hypothetical protein